MCDESYLVEIILTSNVGIKIIPNQMSVFIIVQMDLRLNGQTAINIGI